MNHVHTEISAQEYAPMLVPNLEDMTALARVEERRGRTVMTLMVRAHGPLAGVVAEEATHHTLHRLMLAAAEIADKQRNHAQCAAFTRAAQRWSRPEGGVHVYT